MTESQWGGSSPLNKRFRFDCPQFGEKRLRPCNFWQNECLILRVCEEGPRHGQALLSIYSPKFFSRFPQIFDFTAVIEIHRPEVRAKVADNRIASRSSWADGIFDDGDRQLAVVRRHLSRVCSGALEIEPA
jgi:hypothetical protein